MEFNINIPTSLKDITLKQYKKFLKIQDGIENTTFLQLKIIEIFCNVDLKIAKAMRYTDVEQITAGILKLFTQQPTLVTHFIMNGEKYGFVPDLDNMTLGEYIDLDTYSSDYENIEIAMNVLYRPIKISKLNKYSIVDYTALTPEVMKDMPLSAVIGSIFFLYNLGITLSKHMIHYSAGTEEEIIQVNQTLQQNGVGINQFMDSLTEILQDLKISLN